MPSDAFFKVDGVEGESTDSKHKSEIEVLSFSWGVTQAITGTVSSSGTFSGQRCDMSPLVVQKLLDKASPKPAQACAAGEHFNSAILTLCRAGGDKQPYMEYKLSDVLIASVRSAARGEGGVPTEEVVLRYAKIEMTTRRSAPTGSLPARAPVGWDLKENKKV